MMFLPWLFLFNGHVGRVDVCKGGKWWAGTVSVLGYFSDMAVCEYSPFYSHLAIPLLGCEPPFAIFGERL